MLSNEYLRFVNKYNQDFSVGFDYEYIPVSFDDSLNNNLNTTKFNLQDGETFISSSLDIRDLKIVCTFPAKDTLRLEKELLSKCVLNEEGTLYKYAGNTVRSIKVRITAKPDFDRKKGRTQATLDMVALEPFWSGEEVTVDFKENSLGFSFPHYWDKPEQYVFGVSDLSNEKWFENVGEYKTGYIATIRLLSDIEGLTMRYYDGDQKKVAWYVQKKDGSTFKAGDIIEVVDYPYYKMCYFNGVKATELFSSSYLDFASVEMGKNGFNFTIGDGNTGKAEISIKYNPRYL